MRMMGHNVLAIVVAAIAIYALEYLIFAVLVPGEAYMTMSGYSAESMQAGMARMPFGVIPPILAAIGLSLAIKWRNKPGWMSGLVTGVLMAVFFAFAVGFYGYVYGPNDLNFMAVSLGHFVACYGAAGAILGAWK
jgi:Protein of unknown function (DUF1761)